MNDRELLEMAAKAAGINGRWFELDAEFKLYPPAIADGTKRYLWRPLQDDGDALRLAARLCLNIEWFPGHNSVQACRFGIGEIIGWVDDSARSGSLRRAITAAAAKIGRMMP